MRTRTHNRDHKCLWDRAVCTLWPIMRPRWLIRMHTNVNAHLHTHMRARTHTRTHLHSHSQWHTHTHKHTLTGTHDHTRALSLSLVLSLSLSLTHTHLLTHSHKHIHTNAQAVHNRYIAGSIKNTHIHILSLSLILSFLLLLLHSLSLTHAHTHSLSLSRSHQHTHTHTRTHTHTHAHRLSIIGIVLAVKAITYPLNYKVYAAQFEMQAIQPEIDRIKVTTYAKWNYIYAREILYIFACIQFGSIIPKIYRIKVMMIVFITSNSSLILSI